MTATLEMKINQLIEKGEGLSLKLYWDTAYPPNATIGYGRNLTVTGLRSIAEARYLMENDIEYHLHFLQNTYPFFKNLNEWRQAALVSMCFNLGDKGFADFKQMIECLEKDDFDGAATQMMNSKWAKQIGQRAGDLSSIIRTGKGI